MSPIVEVPRFREQYRRAVRDIRRFITAESQKVIARHNAGLHPSKTDLGAYLDASETRYVRAIQLFNAHLERDAVQHRALDVGGFLGAYPLTLARLGLTVTLAEVYAYYRGALDDLSAFLSSEGIEIWDVDFTEPLPSAATERFTMVTNMAMLEHLSDSPERLLQNLRRITDERGALVVETPNIAYWPTRLALLRGRTVHPPLDVVYQSENPFLGHHREYTVAEVIDVLRWAGFRVQSVQCFNYTPVAVKGTIFERLATTLVDTLPTLLFENFREVIIALALPETEPTATV